MYNSKMFARKFQLLTVQLKITDKNEIIFHLVTSSVKSHRHDMASTFSGNFLNSLGIKLVQKPIIS